MSAPVSLRLKTCSTVPVSRFLATAMNLSATSWMEKSNVKYLEEKEYESIHGGCEELVKIFVARCMKLDSEVCSRKAEG